MQRPFYYIFTLCLVCLLILSAQKDQDNSSIEEQIEQKIAEELKVYKKIKKRRCREKVLKRAHALVDSSLIARAKLSKMNDTLMKPPKPIKPVKPEIITPPDSTEILAPLLDSVR